MKADLRRQINAADPELLTRALAMIGPPPAAIVDSPGAAAEQLRPLLAGYETERLAVLFLDRRLRVKSSAVLSIGTDTNTIVDPRTILRSALLANATAIIVGHNHPSGDLRPSEADREVTARLDSACRIVGIELADHVIIAGMGSTSFRALGMLTGGRISVAFSA